MVLADPAKSRAVLVGAHSYSFLEDLPAVENNLTDLSMLLSLIDVWGLPKSNLTTISQPKEASMVAQALQDAGREATDTLLFYYAGHGLLDVSSHNLMLALVDSRAEAAYSALPFEWLRSAVIDSNARRKILILDCCYSARAFNFGMSATSDLASEADVEGSYILAAAAETKKAVSPPGERYTAFTGELISVIESGIVGAPQLLEMAVIYTSVRARLTKRSRPIPQQRNRNSAARISISKNRAWEPDQQSFDSVSDSPAGVSIEAGPVQQDVVFKSATMGLPRAPLFIGTSEFREGGDADQSKSESTQSEPVDGLKIQQVRKTIVIGCVFFMLVLSLFYIAQVLVR